MLLERKQNAFDLTALIGLLVKCPKACIFVPFALENEDSVCM